MPQITVNGIIKKKLDYDRNLFAGLYNKKFTYSDVLYQWIKIMRLAEENVKIQTWKQGFDVNK